MVTVRKRLERLKNIDISISDKDCSKCDNLMEHRKHILPPNDKVYYYSEWDYCTQCKHIQHYEKYKVYKDFTYC